MRTHTFLKIKLLACALLAGSGSCIMAEEPVAVYQIGWDDGDGDNQNGQWHTVPKLVQGSSTIEFTNQGFKSEVQSDAGGGQVLKIETGAEQGDMLSFTETCSSSRRYVVTGEARCENVSGRATIAMGLANSNYAGTVGTAATTDGKSKWWQGTEDWRSFSIQCALPSAIRPQGATEASRFIAEVDLKRSGAGTLYLRNLRLDVYGDDLSTAHEGAHSGEHFSLASFQAGLGVGILACLGYLRIRRINHERQMRRIVSLDVPQR
jgi:hypothetical protein